jgi:RNA polymerase primary sigma factor
MKNAEKKTAKDVSKSRDTSDPIRLYLKDVSKNPLLTHAQEIELSKAIVAGKQSIMDTLFAIPLTAKTMNHWISGIASNTRSPSEVFDIELDDDQVINDAFSEQLINMQALCVTYLADPADSGAREALVSAFNDLPLSPVGTDQLIKQVQEINLQMIKLDSEIVKLAVGCGIDRQVFIDRYVGSEHMDWLANEKGKNWQKLISTHGARIQEIKDRVRNLADAAGLPVLQLRTMIRDLGKHSRAKETAVNTMVRSNLRLVVSVAKKYNHASNNQHNLMDLVQEGNIGLIKAVEKFKWELGYRFSTYATWWIRQAIFKAAAEHNRTIRIPSHVIDSVKKINRAIKDHVAVHGREPSMTELSAAVGMDELKIARMQRVARDPISLETPVGEDDDGKLGNYIEDTESENAFEQIAKYDLNKVVAAALGELSSREERVVRMRFGIGTMEEYTLEEIGQKFNVTRERVRQIEAKALERLRSPSRQKELAAALKD